jgi:hypothetical protein
MKRTITDKQIRQLRDEMARLGDEDKPARRLVQECNLALNLPRGFDRDMWRAHCAEIIHSRADASRTPAR